MLAVNQYEYVDYIDELVNEEVRIPVLQDTVERDLRTELGAERWFIYIFDQDGRLRHLHYDVDVIDDERERLLTEIQDLLEER